MHYFLFNNVIYYSDGHKVQRIEKGPDLGHLLQSIEGAGICVLDVDVELASAPETPLEKKDSMLARKFAKLHPGHEYVLQDEKIEDNIFQVIGIKSEKVREIYDLVPSEKLKVLIPYAMALRFCLQSKGLELSKGIVFIDDLGDEKLITVFAGLKFSVTRTLTGSDRDTILPEIKRSQIGFSKKIEEFDNGKQDKMTLMTNSREIASLVPLVDPDINIEYIDLKFPALEGLSLIKAPEEMVKFLLPEEIKSKKRKQDLKKRAMSLGFSLVILSIGLGFALFNKLKLSVNQMAYARLSQQDKILENKLFDLDQSTYREDLKKQKYINYAYCYLELLNTLPLSYTIDSFRYYPAGRWRLEAYILAQDGASFDEIPQENILRYAVINDYFIKNKPGKRILIDL